MPITYEADCAVLEGRCPAEEADALLGWLRTAPDPIIHLNHCDEIHTAILQLLLASRARIVAPRDLILAQCLAAAGISLLALEAQQANETSIPNSRRAPHGDALPTASQVQL